MRKGLRRVLSCAIVLLAVPSALLLFAFGLPAQYGETFLGALGQKRDALAAAEGRRVVVIGGSSVAFGQDSALLEEALPGRSVVNFGMYAGLGTTVMLDLAEPLLREGDVVVFSPEQSAQTLSTYLNAEAMWQAADGHFELLASLDTDSFGAMAGQFPYFAASKARYVRDGNAPAGDGVYARAAFNAYGDIDCDGREQNEMPDGFDPNMPIVFDTAVPTEAFFEKVNAFTDACAKKGVAVYYRFCPMNRAAVSESALSGLDDYCAFLREKLRCPVLGDPEASILDPEWFYDTNFHLNSAGAVVNTARLAADLKAALGDPSPTEIPLPEKPPMARAAAAQGDNSDEDCFLYETADGAARIVGLTAEGAARERITVSVTHGGLPVTGFSADTFAGNAVLRELVVQSNIRTIEDRSFLGCTALERVILTNSDPSACSVGTGLLDGTAADVVVPAGRLGAYRTNYFWAVHAARIRETESTAPGGAPAAETPVVSGPSIRYEGNGGTRIHGDGDSVTLAADSAHLRVNTAQGASYFRREGYVLTGWNTAPDGSGTEVGLGSRTERQEGLTLYAQWAKAAPEACFAYEIADGGVYITGCTQAGDTCVIPERIEELPVRGIRAGAFRGAELETLVFPSGLRTVEEGAFENCRIGKLCLFDALSSVSDGSFVNCEGPATLRVNAAVSPVYSGSYFDTFSDKYDRLLSLRGEKKLVLFSGSSGRYGYDSAAIAQAFPEYQVANMGVYAYTNALPQLMLILELTEAGDMLLSAPEFDAAAEQFCASNCLDASFWAMMESNYDAAALLDMREFTSVFDSFGAYLTVRQDMAGKSYSISPGAYDDDGNRYAFATYNSYGDFILPRPNGDRNERLHNNIADYTVASIPTAYVDSLNAVYRRFLEKDITVYFTYTPRNRFSLTEESTPAARRALHEYLSENLCVPVISDIEDSLFDGIYFYLIDSHLSSEGAALRTALVIADLRRVGFS